MAQLTDEALKEITDYIEVQGRAWAKEYIAGRIAYFGKKNLKAKGDLIQSLKYEVTTNLEQAAQNRISLEFNRYGRFIDLKDMKPGSGGADYLKMLKDWIQEKGFDEQFKSRFLEKRKLKTLPQNALNQMAWGIIKNRQSRYKRRLAWYAKSRAGALNDLYNKVAANIPRIVGQEIKNAFKAA